MLPLNSVMSVIYNFDDSECTFDFAQNAEVQACPGGLFSHSLQVYK
jgi:hypothetical protein